MGEGRNEYRVLVRISEGKRQLEIYKYRRKNNTKKNLKEMGLEFGSWSNLFNGSASWQVFVNTFS
jgi:hypothetical protein